LVDELKTERIRVAYEEQLRREPQDVKMTHRDVVPQEPPYHAPAAAKPPEARVIPREQAQERIAQGLHEFRSGRYLQAELAFLRAVPEACGYVVLTCFIRGEVREAVQFLGRALAADPEWLRRVKPRDLFGAPEDYEKALRALEERVAADPLDAEAKTLLAYFQFHEKGPEYAKALLVEATNARPDHAEARQLQAALR
jgi:tetratricopeptide (TPR) repeat protein